MLQNRFLYLISLLLLPCLTYFLHEYVHWIVYRFYGIDALLFLNTIELSQEDVALTKSQQFLIYGSGVLFTFFQGIAGCIFALKKDLYFGSVVLFSAAVFRWAAILQGVVASSDEIKMSQAMGVHDIVWPLIISGSFLLMIFYVYTRGLPLKFIYGTSLLFLLIIYFYNLI